MVIIRHRYHGTPAAIFLLHVILLKNKTFPVFGTFPWVNLTNVVALDIFIFGIIPNCATI